MNQGPGIQTLPSQPSAHVGQVLAAHSGNCQESGGESGHPGTALANDLLGIPHSGSLAWAASPGRELHPAGVTTEKLQAGDTVPRSQAPAPSQELTAQRDWEPCGNVSGLSALPGLKLAVASSG